MTATAPDGVIEAIECPNSPLLPRRAVAPRELLADRRVPAAVRGLHRGLPAVGSIALPLGHALGGFAAGWLIAPDVPPPLSADERARMPLEARLRWRRAWLFAAVGLVADVDFFAGQHRAYTHSVGAVMAVFGISLLLARGRARDPVRLSLAIAASYASHVLFDWLGADSPAPRGIMALWPFTDAHYVSRVDVFPVVSRKILTVRAWKLNLIAAATEATIVGFAVYLCWRFRDRRGR